MNPSELIENLEELFPRSYRHIYMFNMLKSSSASEGLNSTIQYYVCEGMMQSMSDYFCHGTAVVELRNSSTEIILIARRVFMLSNQY